MGPTLSPETSAFKLQTPGKFPEEYKVHSEHGESLKTTRHDEVNSFFFSVLRKLLKRVKPYSSRSFVFMTRSQQTLSRTFTAEVPKGIIGFYFTGWFRGTDDELP